MPIVPLQINRPRLPDFTRLIDHARDIDTSRYYTNFGPKHDALRLQLAALFGLNEPCVGLAASGSAALSALVQARAGRARPFKPLCVCPSFTFVATAAAAVEAGYTPYFADIDPRTWALDPDGIARMPLLHEVGAVIVTAAMGRMVDLHAWQAFADRTRIPVIVDAAAGFDTLDPAALRAVRLPVMISLHATKTFSTCEGGLLLCSDPEVIRHAMAVLNFGFEDERISMRHGMNGKMSEYHAIIGLCELEDWDAKRTGFRRIGALYRQQARDMGLATQVIADGDHALPYAHVLAEDGVQAGRITAALDADLIGWRRWYGMGIQNHPAFHDFPTVELPETRQLAERLISLPMAVDMEPDDVHRTLQAIRSAIRND